MNVVFLDFFDDMARKLVEKLPIDVVINFFGGMWDLILPKLIVVLVAIIGMFIFYTTIVGK